METKSIARSPPRLALAGPYHAEAVATGGHRWQRFATPVEGSRRAVASGELGARGIRDVLARPSAERKDFFEFDEKKRKLPSRHPLGRVFVLRAPSRRELRIVCSLTTEDPAVARVKQLRPGQSPK